MNKECLNFKPGDYITDGRAVAVFKENSFNAEDNSGCMYVYCEYDSETSKLYPREIGGINPEFWSFANEEEKELLDKMLTEWGFVWDVKFMRVRGTLDIMHRNGFEWGEPLVGHPKEYSIALEGLTKEQYDAIDAIAKTWGLNKENKGLHKNGKLEWVDGTNEETVQ
jgi:hypothetical protein